MSADEAFVQQLSDMAEQQAKTTATEFGVELDFSPESLDKLDEVIARPEFKSDGNDSAGTGLGVYVGEVIRRNLGARWTENEEYGVHLRSVGDENMISLPIRWIQRRIGYGHDESLMDKYRSLVHQLEGRATVSEGTAAFIAGPDGIMEEDHGIPEILVRAPAIIFHITAAADGEVDDEEREQFMRFMADYTEERSPLFKRVVVAMRPKINQYFAYLNSPEFNDHESLDLIQKSVDAQFTEEEARAFKVALLDLGKSVADASGGFLGFGDKISEEEITWLTHIAEVFGLAAEK